MFHTPVHKQLDPAKQGATANVGDIGHTEVGGFRNFLPKGFIHIPTGKRCTILHQTAESCFCDFGPLVFTWVKKSELRRANFNDARLATYSAVYTAHLTSERKRVVITHVEFALRQRLSRPCNVHDVNYGGGCFNCGYRS